MRYTSPMGTCKECSGTGVVTFSKEKGGPQCQNCGGVGHITPEHAQRAIASILDYPSVYMGGPSQQSMRRALQVIEYLKNQNFF